MPIAKLKVAVFISGGGTTLRNLIERSASETPPLDIRLVVSSRSSAGGLEFARNARVPSLVVAREKTESAEAFSARNFDPCRAAGVDYVLMAGYLKHVQIPADF